MSDQSPIGPDNTLTAADRPDAALTSGITTRSHPSRPPRLPRVVTDADGRTVLIDSYDETEFSALVRMYERFDPANRASGLPPVEEPHIRDWLDGVLGGASMLAWHRDEVVGHAMCVPDNDDGHELAVFVHGAYHNAGIGSELVRTCLAHLRTIGSRRVWLTVDRWNEPALHLYRKVGFTVDDAFHSELKMSYEF